jgi:hypothetical protein
MSAPSIDKAALKEKLKKLVLGEEPFIPSSNPKLSPDYAEFEINGTKLVLDPPMMSVESQGHSVAFVTLDSDQRIIAKLKYPIRIGDYVGNIQFQFLQVPGEYEPLIEKSLVSTVSGLFGAPAPAPAPTGGKKTRGRKHKRRTHRR